MGHTHMGHIHLGHTHTGHTRAHMYTHAHTHGTHVHTRSAHTHIPAFGNIFLMQMLQPPAGKIAERTPGGRRGTEGLWQRCLHSKDTSQKDRHQLRLSAGN